MCGRAEPTHAQRVFREQRRGDERRDAMKRLTAFLSADKQPHAHSLTKKTDSNRRLLNSPTPHTPRAGTATRPLARHGTAGRQTARQRAPSLVRQSFGLLQCTLYPSPTSLSHLVNPLLPLLRLLPQAR